MMMMVINLERNLNYHEQDLVWWATLASMLHSQKQSAHWAVDVTM